MNPTFIMMVGLPYSGKSYYAEKLSKEYGAVIHSSDAIRAEILGDVQDQNNNGKVFEVLHRRVYDDLSNGKSGFLSIMRVGIALKSCTQMDLRRSIPRNCSGEKTAWPGSTRITRTTT